MATPTLPPMRAALRKLCQHGQRALQPTKLADGKWRQPMVNKRNAARIRKEALLAGTYGSFDAATGTGWDPMWDNPGKTRSIRPPKGHKRERTREARAKNIEKLLEEADEKIEEYRKEIASKKPEKGIKSLLDELMGDVKRKKK